MLVRTFGEFLGEYLLKRVNILLDDIQRRAVSLWVEFSHCLLFLLRIIAEQLIDFIFKLAEGFEYLIKVRNFSKNHLCHITIIPS